MIYEVTVDGKPHRLEIEKAEDGWLCRIDEREIKVDAVMTRQDVLSILVDGRSYEIKRQRATDDLYLWVGSTRFAVEVRDPRSLRRHRDGAREEKGPKRVLAPMAGRVVRVLVNEGAEVEAGQGIMVVEAMKMQNEIKSPKKGVVHKLMVTADATVNAGEVLAIVE